MFNTSFFFCSSYGKAKLLNFRDTFIFQQALAYITAILPQASRSSLTNQKLNSDDFFAFSYNNNNNNKNPPRSNNASGFVEESLTQGRMKKETISMLQKYTIYCCTNTYTVITGSLVCLPFSTKNLPWGCVLFNFASYYK